MQPRRGLAAAGKDEAAQRLELVVGEVDPRLEPFDLCRHDPQDHFGRGEVVAANAAQGRGEIGAEIEQVVLDPCEMGDRVFAELGLLDRPADRRVGLVDRADSLEPQGMFGQP